MECPKCYHESATDDYCDQCGAPLGARPGAPPTTNASATSPSPPQQPRPAVGAVCTVCGSPRERDELFCETCGCDFATGELPKVVPTSAGAAADREGSAPRAWEVLVSVDEGRWQSYPELHEGVATPPVPVSRPLVTGSISIGRASRSRSIIADLDLAELTGDPAVSHRHGRISLRSDGAWEVVDLGSENGMTCNGRSVSADETSVLADGDVIRLGAWSCITIRARS